MIAAIEGILEGRGIDSALIKVGGISFRVYMPSSTLNQLGTLGNKVHLHVHLYLKEDNIALYGFASAQESNLFQHLISVSGIGPRTSLALLSSLSYEQLISAIKNSNVDFLTQVPGVGKKTASRLILELKGKLEKEGREAFLPLSAEDTDIIAALTSLGYSLKEATQIISTLPNSQELSLEERFKLALQYLAS